MSSSDSFESRYIPDREVGPELDLQLRGLFLEAFPHEAAYLKTQRYFRECPEHRWIVFTPQNQPVAHVAVHEKKLGTSHGPIAVTGIAEVCVTAPFRGQGLVRRLLREIHPWAQEREFSHSLLFGNLSVYRSSGYRRTTNVYRHWDHKTEEWREETISGALALPYGDKPWPEGLIDLAGPMF